MIRVITLNLILAVLGSPLSAGLITLDKRARDQLKKETVYAIDLIQRYHYKQTNFSDIDPEELLTAYMEDLDGTKMFYLQEDVDFVLERFGSSLKPSYLYVGDLYPAFETFNIYYTRVSDRLEWIQNRLTEPFDFDSDATYLIDRDEAEWPKSTDEADVMWDKRLTNELIMELLEDEPLDRAIDKISKRYERMENSSTRSKSTTSRKPLSPRWPSSTIRTATSFHGTPPRSSTSRSAMPLSVLAPSCATSMATASSSACCRAAPLK
jgi:hypothetical protein